ncbi:MAG: DUF1566 domain-containing protein [Leptospira sp.]|nr:DUF1566 domain-containing protein [Leptospira sp.]
MQPLSNNACDLNSDAFSDSLFANSILGNAGAHCGINFTPTPTSKEISVFLFAGSINSLSKSYVGTISGTSIAVKLPYAIRSAAIPSFLYDGVSITVGSNTQTSGITLNNFSNPVTYKINAADGSTKSYTVTVTPITPIPDTGQTSCWDAAGTLLGSCTGTGQDGAYDIIPNARSFTGPTASSSYASDYTTRDTLTGLLWKSCTEGLSGVACTNGVATTQFWTASASLCSALNTANAGGGFAGKTNWRLPTVNELANIANYQSASPTLDAAYFPASLGSGYWSYTQNASNLANYWYLNYLNGTIGDFPDATAGYARCVSGDLPPPQSFTDNGDSTVTDNNTNLVWTKCSDGLSGSSCASGGLNTPVWATALTTCNSLVLAGKTWRLPNVNELRSIMDYSVAASPLINPVFPATAGNQYWSSSSFATGAAAALLAYFNTGSISNLAKGNVKPIRCIAN